MTGLTFPGLSILPLGYLFFLEAIYSSIARFLVRWQQALVGAGGSSNVNSYRSFERPNGRVWRNAKDHGNGNGNGHSHGNGNTDYVGRDLICDTGWAGVCERLGMSRREFQITQLLFDDMNEAEIADQLGISRHTVHTHLERLYRKMSVTSRVQLVVRVVSHYMSLCDYPGCERPTRKCPLLGRLVI